MATLSASACRSFSASNDVNSSMRWRSPAKTKVICATSAFEAVVSASRSRMVCCCVRLRASVRANCPSTICRARKRSSRASRAAARAASVSACLAERAVNSLVRVPSVACTNASCSARALRSVSLVSSWICNWAKSAARSALARRSIFSNSLKDANC